MADLLALASKSADALGGTFGVSSIDHRSEGSEVQLALMRNDAGQTVALSPDQVAKIRMETLQQYFKETKDGKELPPK